MKTSVHAFFDVRRKRFSALETDFWGDSPTLALTSEAAMHLQMLR
jgi:hypothetical protein